MRYYIADLHFFHAAMNQRMDRRGFANVEETNALLKRLNGRLYLIQGNYDRFLANKEMDVHRFQWIKHGT